MLDFWSRNLKILRLRLRTRSGFHRRSNGQFRVGKTGGVEVKTTNQRVGVDKEQIETRLKNAFCVVRSISLSFCTTIVLVAHIKKIYEKNRKNDLKT